jgi:hypothetical protein
MSPSLRALQRSEGAVPIIYILSQKAIARTSTALATAFGAQPTSRLLFANDSFRTQERSFRRVTANDGNAPRAAETSGD